MTPALFVLIPFSVKIDPRAGQSRVGPKRPLVNISDRMRMRKLVQGPVPILVPAVLRFKDKVFEI